MTYVRRFLVKSASCLKCYWTHTQRKDSKTHETFLNLQKKETAAEPTVIVCRNKSENLIILAQFLLLILFQLRLEAAQPQR